MNAANGRNSAEIVALDGARAQREAAAPALDTAGAMLRAAREDAGLSVRDVADEINVKPERLAAIETADLGALPSAPYTLGFVRAYADFLGLPVEPLVTRFREEAGWARAVTAPKIAAPPRAGRDREVGLAGIIVVLLFIVWALWQIVGRTPPEDEAALPSGFPIADRTVAPQVVPEVTTSLEDDLTRTPPMRVEDAEPVAAPATPSVGGVGPDPAPGTVRAEAIDRTSRPAGKLPPIVPIVLASPLGEAVPEPVPARPARPAEPSPSDRLNERLLREVMADSEPGRAVGAAPSPAAPEPVPAPRTESRPEAASPVEAQPAPQVLGIRAPARLVDPVSPVYPRRCRRSAADEEVVTVRFSVSRFGRVTGPSVAQSTNDCFDDAALAAVSRFGFEPAEEGGRAVAEAGRTSRIVFRKP